MIANCAFADSADAFEGEVTLIVEVKLEYAAFSPQGADYDGCNRHVAVLNRSSGSSIFLGESLSSSAIAFVQNLCSSRRNIQFILVSDPTMDALLGSWIKCGAFSAQDSLYRTTLQAMRTPRCPFPSVGLNVTG